MFLIQSGEETIALESLEYVAQVWLNNTRGEMSPSTTGRRVTSIRSWAKWAGDPLCLSDYVAPVAGRGVAHPIREGKEGLLRMIAKANNSEQAAIIGLTGLAGCRISEARDVRPSWINVHDMLLTVRGKGDKTRTVPLSADAWSAISEAYVNAKLKGTDEPLIHYGDAPARSVVSMLGRRAKLSRHVSSHDMRHTYGSLAFDKTKNIRVVQELLGHGHSSTTEIYTGVNEAALREAVEF